jgi:hypothetical protein
MNTLRRTFAALLCGVLGGCATVNHMAFDKKSNLVNPTSKSVVLVTIDLSRPDKSRFELVPFVVKFEKPNAQSKQVRQNFTLSKDADTVKTEDGHTLYLARVSLDPGPYELTQIMGNAGAFPIAQFLVPILSDFNVPPRSIVYVGRITATLRPRASGEFRAGPVGLLPNLVLAQAVAGISTSTWDVTIDDRSDSDLPLFRQTFKAIESAQVVKSPLSPFDRAAVQRWSDNNSPKDKDKTDEATVPSPAGSSADATP